MSANKQGYINTYMDIKVKYVGKISLKGKNKIIIFYARSPDQKSVTKLIRCACICQRLNDAI